MYVCIYTTNGLDFEIGKGLDYVEDYIEKKYKRILEGTVCIIFGNSNICELIRHFLQGL